MTHEVRAVVKCIFHAYVDDDNCEKTNAEIIQEGRTQILNGEGELVEDFEMEACDIENVWLDHSF